MKLGCLALWTLSLPLSPAAAWCADTTVILSQIKPGIYHINGEFTVDVAASTAWDVITDYDEIDRFVSSIDSSRILRRESDSLVIEQIGTGKFFFFSRKVKLTLEVKETPPQRLEFRKIYGPQFDDYAGSWTISTSNAGCTVRYTLDARPSSSFGPRFIAKRVLKNNIQRLLDEVRQEMIHRNRPNI